jgi:hypothetical protein
MKEPEIKLKPKLDIIKPDKELLLPGELGATVELILSDSLSGKVTERRGPMKSESFVRQFFELLWIQMYPIVYLNPYPVKDTGGTTRNIGMNTNHFATNRDCRKKPFSNNFYYSGYAGFLKNLPYSAFGSFFRS